jgi:hypothetical protein
VIELETADGEVAGTAEEIIDEEAIGAADGVDVPDHVTTVTEFELVDETELGVAGVPTWLFVAPVTVAVSMITDGASSEHVTVTVFGIAGVSTW